MKRKNRPIKILNITDALPDYYKTWGGAEKVAYRQIKTSTKLEDKEIFVGATKPVRRVEENFTFLRIYTIEDFLPQKLSHYATTFKSQAFPFDLVSFFSLMFILLKIKPQVIHLHRVIKISLAPMIVAKIFGIPITLSIYDYLFFCPKSVLLDKKNNPCYKFHGPWCRECSVIIKESSTLKLFSFFRRRIFDFFLSKANRFSVLSNASLELISKYSIPKEKIFIVSQAFISHERINGVSVEPYSVFFNIWMQPHKGVDIVIRTIPKVLKVFPQTKFYIAIKDAPACYEDDYFKEIKKMMKDLDIEKNITFFERPSHKQYLQLIEKSTLVIVAEQWENMAPTTLTDAMSLGKPVVASKIGGIPEIITDNRNGLLANPKDLEMFAEKIIKILSDKALAKRLGERAKERIKTIGQEKNIKEQLYRLYQFT